MKRSWMAGLMVLFLGAGFSYYTLVLSAADTDFPIYFENSTLALKSSSFNRVIYLPLLDILRHLNLSYTEDTRLETFTIDGATRLTTTKNSAIISLNDQIVLLQDTVRHEDGQWLVPLDFLSQGISRVTGIQFRYRPGASRMFARTVNPVELVMNAQALGPATRLTLRTATAVEWELQKDDAQRRAVLFLKGKPIDPLRERLDYKDRLLESVTFDDADGIPKIVVGFSGDVRDIRAASADENRVYFLDFVRESAGTAPVNIPAAPAPRPDAFSSTGGLRVIVVDPGHGGDEPGVTSAGIQEKDLTLAIARKLRTTLQTRLGSTVLLTRDSDVALTTEERAAIANSNQAGLLISLHVGYSANRASTGSSIYVMQDSFALLLPQAADRLFLPWYLAYRPHLRPSEQMAQLLQQELTPALPGWQFPLRAGPIGVLASATMPAVAVEIGNLNNPTAAQTLTDEAFQVRMATTIATAVGQFAATRSAGRP